MLDTQTTADKKAEAKSSETGQDVLTTSAGPVVTLNQVKDALAKVAAHPQCSEKMANTIAINSGGVINASRDPGRLPREAWETIKPKKFERVLRKCESVLENAAAEDMVATERKAAVAEVDVVGKQITSLADKIKRECEAEGKHRAEASSFFQTLTEKLKEAEPLAKAAGITMKALKEKYVGDRLGETRFKLALRIARGRITHEQARATDAKLAREKRAKAKLPASDVVVRGADGKPLDTSGFGGPAKEQLEAELARSAGPKPVGPGIPGIPEPVVEPKQGLDNVKSSPVPALVPALDLMPETLEQCLDRMMVKEAKSVVPAFTVCVQCIEYLVPFMNEGTRAQLRKDISAITNAADKRTRKAA